jgi:ABC-2 type transport system permease protein
MRRYPAMTLMIIVVPVIFLLLFVYVFGGTLGAGLGHLGDVREAYLRYVTPGIILLTLGTQATSTAVSVAMDMSGGIIARFRTMAIARVSVLTGHVLGSVIQTVVGAVAVAGLALALGFRPTAGLAGWLGAIGLVVLLAFACTWVSVALGLLSPNPQGASNSPLPLALLPFLGSTFVPAQAMAPGLRWFAEYQPFTPVVETLRGLLLGTPAGDKPAIACAWCAGLALAGYLCSRALFNRGARSSK